MESKTFYYRMFDLEFKSQFEIPQAEPSIKKTGEINIEQGKISAQARQSMEENKGSFGAVSKTDMWFRYGHKKFQITNGNQITVELDDGYNNEHLLSFMLGSVSAILLIQRGLLPVHGGCLIKDGRAFIITGESGAGKSTVTNALTHMGYKFLSDDVSVVQLNDDIPYILPAYPQMKLCEDAAVNLGYNLEDLHYLGENRNKYAIRGSDMWHAHQAPLACIFEISVDSSIEEPVAVAAESSDKLALLCRNLYRGFMNTIKGPNPQFMLNCIKTANYVKAIKIKRPQDKPSLDKVLDIILTSL